MQNSKNDSVFVQFNFRMVGNTTVKLMKHDSGMDQQLMLL